MKLKLKYSQDIPNVDENEKDKNNTAGLGIAITIAFLVNLIYSLVVSISKDKMGSAVLTNGKKSLTISQAIFYSNKGVAFFSGLLFGALTLYMLYRKNFFEIEFNRLFVIVVLFSIPIFFIVFTFVGPNNFYHFPLAAVVFSSATIIWYFIKLLYEKYFIDENNDLNNFVSFVYLILGSEIFLLIVIFINFYLRYRKGKKVPNIITYLFDDLLALGEYIHLFLFCVLLYYFSTFVALPTLDPPNSSNDS
jgi:hypothetical protein